MRLPFLSLAGNETLRVLADEEAKPDRNCGHIHYCRVLAELAMSLPVRSARRGEGNDRTG
jgi:hypothetical protein